MFLYGKNPGDGFDHLTLFECFHIGKVPSQLFVAIPIEMRPRDELILIPVDPCVQRVPLLIRFCFPAVDESPIASDGICGAVEF